MIAVTNKIAKTCAVLGLVALAACQDIASPVPTQRSFAPDQAASALLGPGESINTLVDTTDARGTHTMVAEYAAGVYSPTPDGESQSIGSVTIRTIISGTASSSSSGACILSTIDRVDVTTGWSFSVKKSGGCDKEISVEFSNPATKQKAVFSFLMIPGKTRIDFGAVR
jgi:hypothetical protein